MAVPPIVPWSADALAEKTKVPRRYLTRVLQTLAASGLVQSKPGPGGGYILSRDTSEITILDVVNSINPVRRITTCPLGLKSHTSLCPLHCELDKTYAMVEESLKRVTIQEMVDSANPILPLCDTKPELPI